MTKNRLLRAFFLLSATTFIVVNGGCTSKKADETRAVVDNADIEKIEAESVDLNADPTLDITASNEVVPSQGPTLDTPPAAMTTETTAAPTPETTPEATIEPSAPAGKTGSTDLSLDYPAENQLPVGVAPAEPTAPAVPVEPAIAPETAPAVDVATAPVVKPAPAIKKITETQPYQQTNGTWINTVYIARPKEKLAEISMKIFGADKSEELKNIDENKYLKTRSVKSGDKIYYSSPLRPEDSTKMLSYYEDIGSVPETYVAKKGDSLKKVSSKLLGFDTAWKEVWITNNMTSKTSLKEGEMIRYWKVTDVATTAEAPKANLVDAAPNAAASEPLPPPPVEAQAQMPPPPPPDMGMAPTEPPPPPADLMPPPQAAGEVAKSRKKIDLDAAAEEEEAEAEAIDSDTMTSLGALGILVALMAFVIIRKKKQKEAQMAERMGAEINA